MNHQPEPAPKGENLELSKQDRSQKSTTGGKEGGGKVHRHQSNVSEIWSRKSNTAEEEVRVADQSSSQVQRIRKPAPTGGVQGENLLGHEMVGKCIALAG